MWYNLHLQTSSDQRQNPISIIHRGVDFRVGSTRKISVALPQLCLYFKQKHELCAWRGNEIFYSKNLK